MCGIAGFAGLGEESDIHLMTRAIMHRGPDDEAYYTDASKQIFFGFRRLSVLDHVGGKQPMRTADSRLTLIFNGEIYNHRELRRDLEARGHRFVSSHADSEVLLHGYREWGQDLPAKLNGMFAFAIHDAANNRLFLARDRFGEKPLFVYRQRGLFAFASELGALTAHSAIKRNWDVLALRKYFGYGYFPAPYTPFEGIEKLPAGRHLTHDLATGRSVVSAYWTFRFHPDHSLEDEASAAEELRARLTTAVTRRLEADVPLGFLLSGGIDSGAMVALAARYHGAKEIHTFNIAFNEPSFDESSHAQYVSRHVGTRHHVRVSGLPQMREDLRPLLRRLDEPLGDPSILPTYQVCAFAREHVTVAISGDGGDELFAGYDPFRALALGHAYRRLVPRGLHRWIESLIGRLPVSDSNLSLDFKLRRALRGMHYQPALWNPVWMAPLTVNEIAMLFGTPVDSEELYAEAIASWSECVSNNPVDRTAEFFTRLYLQDNILTKSDRASMLCSLELRAPFLDNDLVDLASRLPAHMKYRNGKTKRVLRAALAQDLPKDILGRTKKGFGIPLSAWLRDLPPPPTTTTLPLDESWLAARWVEHSERRADWRQALWCWLTLRAKSSPDQTCYKPNPRVAGKQAQTTP